MKETGTLLYDGKLVYVLTLLLARSRDGSSIMYWDADG